jgi:hypothetical protein
MQEWQISTDEFQRLQDQCRAIGFGDNPEEDAGKYDPTPIIIDVKILPTWMAEVFGRMSKMRANGTLPTPNQPREES